MRILFLTVIMISSTMMSSAQSSLIDFNKGPCFGQCPVYKITITNEGRFIYEGKHFVDQEGIFERTLSKKELRKLKRKIRKARFKDKEDEYGMRVMDVSTTTLTYTKGDFSKKITYRMDLPEKLAKLEKFIISLSPIQHKNADDWEFTEVNKKKPERKTEQQRGRKEIEQKTIIVQLKPDVDFELWVQRYKSYAVEMNKKLVPNRPLFLVRFDPKTIQLGQLIAKMKADPDVSEAEENQKVKMR